MFVAFWYAAYALVKRPGLMPSDPFGASASRIDFGRALADSALLVLMATLGVIARVHETTAQAAQMTIGACFLFGAAIALERPLRGGLVAGVAIGATVMTRGIPPAAALVACACLVPLLSPRIGSSPRAGSRRRSASACCVGRVAARARPLGAPRQQHLARWLDWNLGNWSR